MANVEIIAIEVTQFGVEADLLVPIATEEVDVTLNVGAPGPPGPPSFPDAPTDGVTYGRINATWTPVLPIVGGTLTGPLVLPDSPYPTDALQAVPKQYVDTRFQPLDADLTALSALSGIDVIYYRSNTDTWSPVTIGANMTFVGGVLSATGGGGGIPDAPSDGVRYLRRNAAWVSGDAVYQPIGSYQPLDGDLTALSALTGTNTIYYRSGADTWTPVTMGGNMTFAGGVLNSTAGGGGGIPEAPSDSKYYGRFNATWSDLGLQYQPLDADLTSIAGYAATGSWLYRSAANTWSAVTFGAGLSFSGGALSCTVSTAGLAPLASPVFTGDPQAPTPALSDNDTSIATTAYVQNQAYARIASPVFTGDPQAPTPATADNDTSIATTAFVKAQGYAVGANYVLKAGDVMSGNLQITKSGPTIILTKTASGQANIIQTQMGGTPRWDILAGNSTAEAGSNAGSDFQINRYTDAGAFIDSPLTITRSTGLATVIGNPTAALGIATKQYVDAAAPALGAWKFNYWNGSGVSTPVALGVAGTALVSTGNAAAPTSQPVLQPGVTNLITVGYTFTPNNIGTISTGTLTPNPALGNYQYYTNNGAHTLVAPSSDCAMDIMVTNGATAGAITFSGFTVGANVGDALTTTNTNKFIVSIRRIAAFSTYTIKALQ